MQLFVGPCLNRATIEQCTIEQCTSLYIVRYYVFPCNMHYNRPCSRTQKLDAIKNAIYGHTISPKIVQDGVCLNRPQIVGIGTMPF